MKTLIKTYYSEPQVDTDKIMKTLFSHEKKTNWSDIFLMPIIGMTVLLVIFGIFLLDLNIDFFTTSISVYLAIGGTFFIVCNIFIGMILFIVENYGLLLLFSVLVFILQNFRIYMLHRGSIFSH